MAHALVYLNSRYMLSLHAGSFAGLGFLSLYLSGKIKVFDRRGHIAKLCIVFFPLLFASLVGISRVDDYWHHWQDVFAGGLIGLSLMRFHLAIFSSLANFSLLTFMILLCRAHIGYILLFAVLSTPLSWWR